MLIGWWKRRRRRRLLATPIDRDWDAYFAAELESWKRFDAESRRDILDIARILVAEKTWVGCGSLELTGEMQWTIAVQAATLLRGLEHDYYRNVASILVQPGGYEVPEHDRSGLLAPTSRAVLGHTQVRGPVVLSWPHVRHGGQDADDGRNVVYHEFAHKLDMLDGVVDGTPPLGDRVMLQRWVDTMSAAYLELRDAAKRGRRSVLDHYGATDEGEFFACATEAFFEKPRQLLKHQPELYALMADFYGQDPVGRAAPGD